MILTGKVVTNEPLDNRRSLLRERVLAKLSDPIRESPELDATLPELIESVKAQGLEGLVSKREDSFWILRRWQTDLRWPNPQRLHAIVARQIIQVFHGPGSGEVPLREPAGSEGWPLGGRTYCREDERVPMVEAGARGPIRIRGVDSRRPPASQPFRWGPGQKGQRCSPGVRPAIARPERT